MADYEFQFKTGALARKNVRTMLESEVFSGRDIRWLEDKKWTWSQFRVRGSHAKTFEDRLRYYLKTLGADT